jgi:hypothetical protein
VPLKLDKHIVGMPLISSLSDLKQEKNHLALCMKIPFDRLFNEKLVANWRTAMLMLQNAKI